MSSIVARCVFCEIVEGHAPADIVYEDELTIAAVDPRQHNPGHVLVIPKDHMNDIRELDERAGNGLMKALVKVTRAVDQAFPNAGMSLWHSVGPAAFQEVPHLHVHVHPRQLDDGLLRVYPDLPIEADPVVRATYAERIRRALREKSC